MNESEKRNLYQLLADRTGAVNCIAHVMCHASTMDAKNELYQQILTINREIMEKVKRGDYEILSQTHPHCQNNAGETPRLV